MLNAKRLNTTLDSSIATTTNLDVVVAIVNKNACKERQ